MFKFKDYLDKKDRGTRRELGLLRRVLEGQGLTAKEHLDGDDLYVFVKADKSLSFEGVRIYKVGDRIAYRVQRESDTHPYGKAYLLDVEEIYSDLVAEDMDEEKAGREVMEAVAKEIRTFFRKSERAEREMNTADVVIDVDSTSWGGQPVQVM